MSEKNKKNCLLIIMTKLSISNIVECLRIVGFLYSPDELIEFSRVDSSERFAPVQKLD